MPNKEYSKKGKCSFFGKEKTRKKKLEREKKEKIFLTCPNCNNTFEQTKSAKKFCCKKCSDTYKGNKSRGQRSEETKRKIGLGVKNHLIINGYVEKQQKLPKTKKLPKAKKPKSVFYCNVCRKEMLHKAKTGLCKQCLDTTDIGKQIKSENGRKVAMKIISEGRRQGWKSRNITSYAEKFWIKVLDNNGIKYQREFIVEHNKNSRYFLDFYIEINGKKLDLEIDGKQHKYPKRVESDNQRDLFLTENNYIVYRIDWNKIDTDKGKQLMKEKIDKFLDFYKSL